MKATAVLQPQNPRRRSQGDPPEEQTARCDSLGYIAQGVLFDAADHSRPDGGGKEPNFFRDLNLDQIVAAITADRDEYDLRPFFHTPLDTPEEIVFRHEIMKDLENSGILRSIKSFAESMRTVRGDLSAAEKFYYQYQRERAFLNAAEVYCETVVHFQRELEFAEIHSRGLDSFRHYLGAYVHSEPFSQLATEVKSASEGLARIRYCLLLDGASITVQNYDGEIDYSADVTSTFDKFKQGGVKDYRLTYSASSDLDHVEARILDGVVKLNPAAFAAVTNFCSTHADFRDGVIVTFDREIQFYVSYSEFMTRLGKAGLKFCYPNVSREKRVACRNTFDLALAVKLVAEKSTVVCNDIDLVGRERILVVTGPNQGGKTTFARMFGQLHYLARLGCPVPGTEACLFLCDQIFTHFEREEDITALHGKLEDDLIRIHEILEQAAAESVVVINEIFSSTSLQDAIYLGGKVIDRLSELDLLCVCVTFLDELAARNEQTVSMVAAIDPQDPTLRTFRVQRTPADGLSYALALAEKYYLTYEHMKERLPA